MTVFTETTKVPKSLEGKRFLWWRWVYFVGNRKVFTPQSLSLKCLILKGPQLQFFLGAELSGHFSYNNSLLA